MKPADAGPLLDRLVALALAAGAEALRHYARKAEVSLKKDASPVTAADKACEALILNGLRGLARGVPVLAEESAEEGRIPELGEEFFLVDPLDGTREFIDRTGEFTINIALARGGKPALGVVYAPALRRLYYGGPGVGAALIDIDSAGGRSASKRIEAREVPCEAMIAVASRSHRSPETDEFLKSLPIADFAAAGSALKFCTLAEGRADVYPRLSRTMEWDTAAGQAILEAAGGAVLVHPTGEILSYGKRERGFDNPPFVAWGRRPS
jgi:3'(2'), 5'-bisphosphate nucleotidase